nr:hypothetical protein CFP56_69089 [Quercus suber]
MPDHSFHVRFGLPVGSSPLIQIVSQLRMGVALKSPSQSRSKLKTIRRTDEEVKDDRSHAREPEDCGLEDERSRRRDPRKTPSTNHAMLTPADRKASGGGPETTKERTSSPFAVFTSSGTRQTSAQLCDTSQLENRSKILARPHQDGAAASGGDSTLAGIPFSASTCARNDDFGRQYVLGVIEYTAILHGEHIRSASQGSHHLAAVVGYRRLLDRLLAT